MDPPKPAAFSKKIFFRRAVVGIFRQKKWMVGEVKRQEIGSWSLMHRHSCIAILQTNFRKPIFIP